MGAAALEIEPSLRALSVERERIARDLHDGVIQSLIAMELRLELLRRQSSAEVAPDVITTLANLQDLIRLEVRNLRHQIEQLRSSSPPCRSLRHMAEIVEDFRRQTGISVTFACDIQEGSIPDHLSHEVFHILEEALSNVRRHSGALNVDVCLSCREETLQVVIQDDGRGFGFTGRLSLAELERTQKGPRVIRERVHWMGGHFTLDSNPKRGSRLEIQFACGRLTNNGNLPKFRNQEFLMEDVPPLETRSGPSLL